MGINDASAKSGISGQDGIGSKELLEEHVKLRLLDAEV